MNGIVLFVGGLVVTVLIDAVVTVYAWRQRPAAGSVALCALTAANGWWALGYLFELLATGPAAKLLWARFEWLGVLAGPVAWLCFTLAYTGRDRYVTPRVVAAIAAAPALAYLAVWTNPLHGLMWGATPVVPVGAGLSVLAPEWGDLYWVILGYSYLVMVVGAGVLIHTARSLPHLYRAQATVLVVGAAVPLLGNVVSGWLNVRGLPLDITPIAFVATGIACAVSLVWLDLLDARPVAVSVARGHVVENMRDAVVITDVHGRVTDANDAAAALFDASAAALRGRRVTALLPRAPAPGDTATVELEARGSVRFFEVNTSSIADAHGRLVGTVHVLRDVTERRLHLQRLEVLNRVLRHNVRNEMNVVSGYADMIATSVPEGSALGRYAGAVSRSATDLLDLAEKARSIETLTDSDVERRTVAVRDVVVDAVTAVHAAYPDAVVVADTLPDPTVRVAWTLDAVVANLVENAAEHNPAPTPHVTVTADAADGWVTIRVRDDGPGIPVTERLMLDAHRETPLVHGDGLGLWLVRWGTQAAGGSVAFRERNPGTEVVVRAPVVDSE